ncbi:hypothetical protein [Paenibacillus radicis (ex Gao et al. 2016)]|uniref:Uncharacterized protein n=1 Tax=Paenibacillus radicis (ex Gao et al. 2016) TaxID=1737354 RepID=A0A917LR04_9BACL|nr:hypothetical protein [Paenibacillus radicis (ex Gao et al. 2016)]GGG52789.1 hypothetical protein GCM10010918_01830 [Paenibacillus radicis (ex Gao et al. 2016)]
MIKANGLHKVTYYKKITTDHSPSFSGIAAGVCKGELWVDHLENANIAIANSYAVGGFAFLGEITSEEQYKKLKGLSMKSKGIIRSHKKAPAVTAGHHNFPLLLLARRPLKSAIHTSINEFISADKPYQYTYRQG